MNNVIEILFCQIVEGDKVFPILSQPCYRLVLLELGHRIASMLRFSGILYSPCAERFFYVWNLWETHEWTVSVDKLLKH